MTGIGLLEKSAIENQLLENPEILKETIMNNPALLEYVFSDADIQRKYVKINPKVDEELKRISRQTGIAEGILLGLGVALLLWLIIKD